jgi:hypothetical protein
MLRNGGRSPPVALAHCRSAIPKGKQLMLVLGPWCWRLATLRPGTATQGEGPLASTAATSGPHLSQSVLVCNSAAAWRSRRRSQPSRVPLAALGDSAELEMRRCPPHAHHHRLPHLLSPRDPARRASGQRQPLPRLHQLPRPCGAPARAPHRRRQPARQGRTRPRAPPQDRRHLDRPSRPNER